MTFASLRWFNVSKDVNKEEVFKQIEPIHERTPLNLSVEVGIIVNFWTMTSEYDSQDFHFTARKIN